MIPADHLITDHGLFNVALADDNVLTEVELAALRAGVPLPCWDDVDAREVAA